jgi:myo-inositol-1(or 4)-monophosphatase
MIIETIRKFFPQHNFLAEESMREEGSSGYLWIIDPLDGTTNFIHRLPTFAVSIGVQYGGDMIAGVIYDPIHNELFSATKNGGAFLNGNQISVNHPVCIADALIATGFPFKRRELIDYYLKAFRLVFMQVSDLRRAGAAALDLAAVACGRLDGFFETGLKPWDCAAGGLLIQEAGGIITDFSAMQTWLRNGNIVAGGAMVHAALLAAVQESFQHIIPY